MCACARARACVCVSVSVCVHVGRFLDRIMTDALEDHEGNVSIGGRTITNLHEGNVSIGGRTITNLRFADDIDGLAGEEEELAKLI